MIGIRVDGNEKIGTGHMMRCLAVAQKLRGMGEAPVFFSVDPLGPVEDAGFELVRLPGVFDDLSGEAVGERLRERRVTTLLVDTYFADRAYFERLGGVKTALVFDMGDAGQPCGLLIDYNINWDDFAFTGAKKTLLGPKYAPLRDEFAVPFERKFGEVTQVLVTTGGTDAAGVTLMLMRAALRPEFADVKFHVVIGGLNVWAEEICAMEGRDDRFVCHQNVRRISDLMRMCDAALSAGGSTLYELCACGTPTVAFSIAQNQDRQVEAMEERGILVSGGVLRAGPEEMAEYTLLQLSRLAKDAKLRRTLSRAGRELVDGEGARRIAWEVMRLDSSQSN